MSKGSVVNAKEYAEWMRIAVDVMAGGFDDPADVENAHIHISVSEWLHIADLLDGRDVGE